MGFSYATFSDPDGNSWPSGDHHTAAWDDESGKDPVRALSRAAAAQGPDETQIGQADRELTRTGTPGS